MYTAKSKIISLPTKGQTFLVDNNSQNFIEWYKRDNDNEGLSGLTFDEAIDLKRLLDKKCRVNIQSTFVAEVAESDVPDDFYHDDTYDKFPLFYPLEELIEYKGIEGLPSEIEIIGYNRFIL